MEWALFFGLLAIAIAIYFGLWGFRKDISDKIADVRDKVMTIGVTLDKAWDLLKIHYGASSSTVVRQLSNMGRTKISAEPGPNATSYIIEVEKPVFHQELIAKVYKEKGLVDKEHKIFGQELQMTVTVFSPTRMRLTIPCIEAKACTDYMTLALKWLDSVYFDSIPTINDFEESILSDKALDA